MKLATLLLSLTALSTSAVASDTQITFTENLIAIQQQWAKTNYDQDEKSKKQDFPMLIEKASALTEHYPDKAEAWIWHGIVQSSYAGAKGGLGALKYVNNAKDAFEKAITIDEKALNGSAHTSLGILYLEVPGWPISFGDEDDAKSHLDKALAFNPNGIDANYFTAKYYIEQKQWDKAKSHLLLAQNAPKRLNRPLADKYRQQEVDTLLKQVNKSLN